jgi:predicted DNA-binding WGR domain protein
MFALADFISPESEGDDGVPGARLEPAVAIERISGRRRARGPVRSSDISAPVFETITNVNRWVRTDSKLWLDARCAIADSGGMIKQRYQLYIEKTDPQKNMARFYAMSIEPNLFGEACLTRRWGRIGSTGQEMVHHFGREKEAVTLFLELLRRKRSRGYKPIGAARH